MLIIFQYFWRPRIGRSFFDGRRRVRFEILLSEVAERRRQCRDRLPIGNPGGKGNREIPTAGLHLVQVHEKYLLSFYVIERDFVFQNLSRKLLRLEEQQRTNTVRA